MGKAKTVVTRTETDEDDASSDAREKREALLETALFSDTGETEDERIEKIHVIRTDPDEGYLGSLDAAATEKSIFERWGGSGYTLHAKNERGRIITRRTLKLAGDPIFASEVYAARWRKQNGVKSEKSGEAGADGFSLREALALIESKAEAARVDAETREEKRRREDQERDEKLRRDEREHRERLEKDKADREERQRKDEREYRERQEREREERDKRAEVQRRDDDDRREKRLRDDEQRRDAEHKRTLDAQLAAAKESQEKNQQFFTNMLAMAKGDPKAVSDPMAQVTQILTLVEALKGASGTGEPQDAVTALLSRLPETLQAAGSMVGNAIREVKGGGNGARQPNPGADNDDGDNGEGDGDKITIDGEPAKKMKQLVNFLIRQGKDPRIVLSQIADHVMTNGQSTKALEARKNAARGGKGGKPVSKTVQRKPRPRVTASAKPPAASPRPTTPASGPAKPAGAP